MKKATRILVLLLILLVNVLSGVYVYRRMRGEEPKPEPAMPAPTQAQAPPESAQPEPPPAEAPAQEPAAAAAGPVATLAEHEPGVKVRAAGEAEWQEARASMPLAENDAVRTFESSTAQLSFTNGDTLEIGQNTLFIVKPLRRLDSGDEIAVAALPGEVADKVAGQPAAEQARSILQEAARREVTIRPVREGGSKASVAVRSLPDHSTGVEAIQGTLKVQGAKGKEVTLKEKMATRVDAQGGVAAPRARLAAPSLVSPSDDATYTFQRKIPRVDLKWAQVERAAEYRIVLSNDPQFKRVFADEKVKGTSFTVTNLPAGTYYWRVRAKDGEGFMGAYSATRSMKAVYDDAPPELAILSPAEMFISPTPSVEIKGRTERAARVKVNGAKVSVGSDGTFAHALTLKEGANLVTIEAIDAAGNSAYGRRVVTYKGGKRSPTLPAGTRP